MTATPTSAASQRPPYGPLTIGGTPLPVVHLNGTGRETLSREFNEAHHALVHAIDAFLDVTCHGRDYYVHNDPDAYIKARMEREKQLSRLHKVSHYLRQHIEHLDD